MKKLKLVEDSFSLLTEMALGYGKESTGEDKTWVHVTHFYCFPQSELHGRGICFFPGAAAGAQDDHHR